MVFHLITMMSTLALFKTKPRIFFRKFAEFVIKVFGPEYLTTPNVEDTLRLLAMCEEDNEHDFRVLQARFATVVLVSWTRRSLATT
jgi:hypothetical protein